MEISTNPIIIEREVKNAAKKKLKNTSGFLCEVKDQIHVTVSPSWTPPDKEKHKTLQVICAPSIVVLNLNHSDAYGHIYTEVMSELLAVEETYKDWDCVIIRLSPLMEKIIQHFHLKISNKVKFVKTKDRFILDCEKLKIINHKPLSYSNKNQNILKLKKAFHDAIPIAETEKNLLIYCSRNSHKTAKHRRKLTTENEDQVVEILKQYAFENDLEFYFWNGIEPDGTSTSILKQYKLFSSAKLVVGVHGGAFSNIIFLDPLKCPTIIEFCPLPGKTFDKLSNGAFSQFASYHKILFQLPLEISELPKQEIIDCLEYTDSNIDLSELKIILNKIK